MSRKTGRELCDEAEAFYNANPGLLAAHVEAAKVFADAGIPVSGQLLTELARYLRLMDWRTLEQILDCYRNVSVAHKSEYAVKNDSVAWLARYLKDKLGDYDGFQITIRKSKIDEREQTPAWDGQNYVLDFGE